MTLPTTEITIFDTTDLFRTNPTLLEEPAFDWLEAQGVDVSFYSGLEAENPNVGFFITTNWDSYERHKEVMHAPFHEKLIQGLVSAIESSPKMYHTQFSAPAAALDKPITEVALITVKTPENHGPVVEVLSRIAEVTENLFVFGRTLEDENKYLAICGWESVEAHREVLSIPDNQEIAEKLRSLVHEDFLYHAKLMKSKRLGASVMC